ncbi:MAG: metallophosphoesterase [Candidatus Diapherotrites archaeon]|nr:metallophosphoesterase [Candidatus Diapherotrites archaeon]
MQIGKTIERIKELAAKDNLIITKNALETLAKLSNCEEILRKLAEKNRDIITTELIEEFLPKPKIPATKPKAKIEGTSKVDTSVKVLKSCNSIEESSSAGKAENFLQMFRHRFIVLKKILSSRHTISAIPIKGIKNLREREEFTTIGMVNRKWRTKLGHLALEIEDMDSRIIAVARAKSHAEEVAEKVLLDDVIALTAVKLSDEIIAIKEIEWPDIPVRRARRLNKEIFLVTTSDLHVGSKLFLEKEFYKFLDWINNPEEELAGKIKYLILSGDNVDGIGIYPQQIEELEIPNIKEQYERLSELLLEVPKDIEIIICPGQHDAVRWADPQPAIPKEFFEPLLKERKIHLVSSPSVVKVANLNVLIYHGVCYHDIIEQLSYLRLTEPEKIMVEILKRRNFMAGYGISRPYVPDTAGYLLIEHEPDIFISGDLHHKGVANYKGRILISNGTFQGQTTYQREQGHVPTPGVVYAVNLATGQILEKNFLGGSNNE